MSSVEENEQLLSEVKNLDLDPIPAVPLIKQEYFTLSGKQSSLVNRVNENNLKIENGRILIKFSEPIWLYDLTLWIADRSTSKAEKLLKHTTVTLNYARGGKSEVGMSASETYIDCFPRDFVLDLEIRFYGVNKTLLGVPPECKKITIKGLTSEEFYQFNRNADTYLVNSKRLSETKAKFVAELTETNAKIIEGQQALAELEAEIKLAKESSQEEGERLVSIQMQVANAESKFSILNTKSSELDQRLAESKRSLENYAAEIQDNRQELDRLLADKHVFMEEYKAYVEQGERNVRAYLIIGVAVFCILALCVWRLLASAIKISADPQLLSTISAFDLFLSRLPLAFVLGTIIVISMKLLLTLLSKTFEIHSERLFLAKLSILAKDNSFASAEGVEVPPAMVYEKRVSLKMELLKEFLSGNYKGATEKQKQLREKFDTFKEGFRKKPEDEKTPENSDAE
jgi:hypothetical protein